MQYVIRDKKALPGSGVLVDIDWFDDEVDPLSYPPPRVILHDQAIIPAASVDDVTDEQLDEVIYEHGWKLEQQLESQRKQAEQEQAQKPASALSKAVGKPRSLGTTGTMPASVREKRRAQLERERARREIEEIEAKQSSGATDDSSGGGTDTDSRRDELERRSAAHGR